MFERYIRRGKKEACTPSEAGEKTDSTESEKTTRLGWGIWLKK